MLWLGGSARGAIAGCHCKDFGGADVVQLQGAIVVCYGWVPV